MDNQQMTAPLDLDALEAAARAADTEWWSPTTFAYSDIHEITREDYNLIAAMSPAVVLELVARLRAAEAVWWRRRMRTPPGKHGPSRQASPRKRSRKVSAASMAISERCASASWRLIRLGSVLWRCQMHTPDQARELWCPMVRIARHEVTEQHANLPFGDLVTEQQHVVAGCNSDALGRNRVPASCRCIAEKCGMWRWGEFSEEYKLVVVDDPAHGPGGKRTENQHIQTGYCGLAGRPV